MHKMKMLATEMFRKNAIGNDRQACSDPQPAGILFSLPCDRQGCHTHLDSQSRHTC